MTNFGLEWMFAAFMGGFACSSVLYARTMRAVNLQIALVEHENMMLRSRCDVLESRQLRTAEFSSN